MLRLDWKWEVFGTLAIRPTGDLNDYRGNVGNKVDTQQGKDGTLQVMIGGVGGKY